MSDLWITCEDCGQPRIAELTDNGVMPCLHYVCCGWGHVAHPDDGCRSPEEALARPEAQR